MNSDIPDSIVKLADAVRSHEVSARETLDHYLARIDAIDPQIGAFRETHQDHARRIADRIDEQIRGGAEPGPLAGVPIAVKDNIAVELGTTACGSRMLEGYRSPFTASAVRRLQGAGAIIIGRTNCDEFGMGSSTENCALGRTGNPWDPQRVPGGSSGGSAAAVSARLCGAALGSDTGGSIRQPAAMCGVVGLKPTYGRISRYGLVAFGSSLDQIGPMTRTVSEAALLLEVMSGVDARDSTSADMASPECLAVVDTPVDDLRIGVPRQYIDERNDPAVAEAVRVATEVFKECGATIVDVDLPMTDYGVSTYYVLAPAEASSNLARYDGIRYGHRAERDAAEDLEDLYSRSRAEGFGAEVQRRIMLGTYVLSAGYYDAYYKRALKVRRLIKHEFDAVFSECHALLGPTSPFTAFVAGEKSDPLSMYLCDVYTTNANIAGHCAISLPAGFAEENGRHLPVGIQLQCGMFQEPRLLRIARMFEKASGLHAEQPPLDAGAGAGAGAGAP